MNFMRGSVRQKVSKIEGAETFNSSGLTSFNVILNVTMK